MERLTRTDISMAINILCNPQSGDESDIRKAVADAIEAMRELQRYKDLEERIEKLFDGKISLNEAVEEIEKKVHGEEVFRYSRILTNAEVEKWDKWLDLEEQGRLIQLPCKVGDIVYVIVPNYLKCENHYDCEDYDSDQYLITWCEKHCLNGYKGIGIDTVTVNAIIIEDDYIRVATKHGYKFICDIFLTKEEAEGKLQKLKEGVE